jgi:hypothetical protein
MGFEFTKGKVAKLLGDAAEASKSNLYLVGSDGDEVGISNVAEAIAVTVDYLRANEGVNRVNFTVFSEPQISGQRFEERGQATVSVCRRDDGFMVEMTAPRYEYLTRGMPTPDKAVLYEEDIDWGKLLAFGTYSYPSKATRPPATQLVDAPEHG